jgi:hypothetical protein
LCITGSFYHSREQHMKKDGKKMSESAYVNLVCVNKNSNFLCAKVAIKQRTMPSSRRALELPVLEPVMSRAQEMIRRALAPFVVRVVVIVFVCSG